MKIRKGLLQYLPPQATVAMRLEVAGGGNAEFNALGPGDRVTVLVVLAHDKEREVAASARVTLAGFEAADLVTALEGPLDPLVIKSIVAMNREEDPVLVMAALNPATDSATIKELARTGPEEVVVVLMEDRKRLAADLSIIDALRVNPLAPARALDNLKATVEVAAASGAHGHAGHRPEDEEGLNLYQRVQRMDVSGKMKLAFMGDKEARGLLIKDSNKIVAIAVLKNPRISDEEISRLAESKSVSEELMRYIATKKEWLKNYTIKLGVIKNPKTPLKMALKFLDGLNEKDLQKLGKNKNVSSVLASAARRKFDMRRH
ncbi:MAG: hypothetical protein ACE5EI_01755 [Thermodesulfobacteriota bacterium]